jgi:ribosomal protein S18 acetylase RimI-like enzyme
MDVKYSTASREDLSVILDFLPERTVFPRYIGYEEPDIVRSVISRSWKAHRIIFDYPDHFPVIIARDASTEKPLGFMSLVVGVEESITNIKQVQIYDYFITKDPRHDRIFSDFIDKAEKVTGKSGLNFLTTEIRSNNEESEKLFTSHGFVVELNRIMKPVALHTFENSRYRQFSVRPAREADQMFVLLLNAQNSHFLIPVGREADQMEIRESYFDLYSEIDIENDPLLRVFIAEDIQKRRPVGYMMIKLDAVDAVSEKQLAYIFDVSVHKDYWGKFVPHKLLKEVENWLHDHGIQYLLGDTAENNPRPLKTAVKTLNFELYSRRWMKKID